MADGDFYFRSMASRWGKVKNQIAGGFDAEAVAGLARLAMGETMRKAGGVPGFRQLAAALFASLDGERSRWQETRDQVLREVRHHPNSEKMAEAGNALLEGRAPTLNSLSEDEVTRQLAQEGLERISQHHLGRCAHKGLDERFETRAEYSTFEVAVLKAMSLDRLANELVEHPDGDGFRTPRRQKPALGTKALLDKPLGSHA